MPTKLRKKILIFISFFIIINSCSNKRIDTDQIDIKLNIKRFEIDLANLKGIDKESEINMLKQKYGLFFKDYLENIMAFGHSDSAVTIQAFYDHLFSQGMQSVFALVKNRFSNFEAYSNQLTEGYKIYKYYYKNDSIPDIITFADDFSGYFNPTDEDHYIGINLSMYLDDTCEYYKMIGMQKFLLPYVRSEAIVSNHFMALGNIKCIPYFENKNLLDNMIYYGKLYHFVETMLPDAKPHIIIGLTEEQQKWNEEEEIQMWNFLIKKELLYETDKGKIAKLINEAPFTQYDDVPADCPPMLGRWMGWQIVKSYMKNNTSANIVQLLKEKDSGKILKESGYKP